MMTQDSARGRDQSKLTAVSRCFERSRGDRMPQQSAVLSSNAAARARVTFVAQQDTTVSEHADASVGVHPFLIAPLAHGSCLRSWRQILHQLPQQQ
jgi:hypothetical protein